MAGPNVNRNGPDSGLAEPVNGRHSGAMRSIEPGISRFRVWSFGPSRNDVVGESLAKQIDWELDHGFPGRNLLPELVLDHDIDQYPARFSLVCLALMIPEGWMVSPGRTGLTQRVSRRRWMAPAG